MHTVSIITATLNRPSLQATCKSIEAQSFTHWYHYVLGDGVLPIDYYHVQRTTMGFTRPIGAYEPSFDKPDGTPNPILRWGLNHLVLGEFLCFLDDDNTYKPTFLERMIVALSNTNVGIAICALEDCRNDNIHDGYPELGRCDNSGFVVRSRVAKEIGFPEVVFGQDNIEDYRFIRACADKYGWIRVPEKLVYFGINPCTPPPKNRAAG